MGTYSKELEGLGLTVVTWKDPENPGLYLYRVDVEKEYWATVIAAAAVLKARANANKNEDVRVPVGVGILVDIEVDRDGRLWDDRLQQPAFGTGAGSVLWPQQPAFGTPGPVLSPMVVTG
jgi:hypothetical protein